MYRLHYAPLHLQDEISCYEFKNQSKMIDFIDEKCINRIGTCVWLLARKGSTDVFISESYLSIQFFLEKMPNWRTVGDYFLQEYDSFEEAYEVALDIVEPSRLCYST